MKLSELIAKAISIKKGNREFALFYLPGEDGEKEWSAEIGNAAINVMLGESSGEFSFDAETPEEALIGLIELLEIAA